MEKKNYWLKFFMVLITMIYKHNEVAVHTSETT